MINCANYPSCEVLDQNNPFRIKSFTNIREMSKYNSQELITSHYYSTFKDNHKLGIRILGALNIDKC